MKDRKRVYTDKELNVEIISVTNLFEVQRDMEQLFINVCKRILLKVAIRPEYIFFNKFALIYFDHPPTCANRDCQGYHNRKQCINEYLEVKRIEEKRGESERRKSI